MANTATFVPRTVVLGGSFNPPHVGHFRIALEVCEALAPERVLFVPCAIPPHKPADSLLPFHLRADMLRAAIGELEHPDRFAVSEVENERPGPSYTVDTLAILAGQYPHSRLCFVMGSEDYAQLASWRRWQEIPALADIAVVQRGQCQGASFAEITRAFFPEARMGTASDTVAGIFSLPDNGHIFYLHQPFLEISSSLIRARRHAGRSLDFLVPRSVREQLYRHADLTSQLWGTS